MFDRFCVALLLTSLLGACGGDSDSAPRAQEAAGAEAAKPPAPVAPPAPAPEPAPPTPQESAHAALEDGRYGDVCNYLISQGFSDELCDWLLETIEDDRAARLRSSRFERWLRSQGVRRIRGRINGWYDESSNEYEARVGGRPAILEVTETSFQTTGGFSMWVQSMGSSEQELVSGRIVDVPMYREWVLYEAITDVARMRRDASAPAVSLLRELLRGWTMDYCREDPPFSLECANTRPLEEVVAERTPAPEAPEEPEAAPAIEEARSQRSPSARPRQGSRRRTTSRPTVEASAPTPPPTDARLMAMLEEASEPPRAASPPVRRLPESPSRSSVTRALGSVERDVRACALDESGSAPTRVAFQGATGRVQSAQVNAPSLPEHVRRCIERAVRGVQVEPFARESFSVVYPYRL
jgi:hypothetical protein